MQKDTNINLRVDRETVEQLEELAAKTYRTKSDMVRLLINREYAQVFGQEQPEPAKAECNEQ